MPVNLGEPCFHIGHTPDPCISKEVGVCPVEDTSSSSDSSEATSCIRGYRDCPRPWFEDDIPGFTIGGIVQYFWVPDSFEPVRRHSYLSFNWDSLGHLKTVELDDFKIPRRFLWDRDEPVPGEDEQICLDSSSLISSGATDKTGTLIRTFALQGTYGCVNTGDSSSSSPQGKHSVPTIFPYEEFKCFGDSSNPGTFGAVDSTLSETISEMALEFDSLGHLVRVYWGGLYKCDPNPVLWDRDDPPANTVGVSVPFLQQSERQPGDVSWDLWILHFDSLGHYQYSCAYLRACACEPTCSHEFCESSIPQPVCVCRPLALITPACESVTSGPIDCPATVTVDCAKALIAECLDDILEPGDCVYTWTLECRPRGELEYSATSSGDADVNEVCYYTESITTCVTADDPDKDT